MTEQTTKPAPQEPQKPQEVKPVREVTDAEVLFTLLNAKHELLHECRNLLQTQNDTQAKVLAEQQETNKLLRELVQGGGFSGGNRGAKSLDSVVSSLLKK